MTLKTYYTGLFSQIGTLPFTTPQEYQLWYRSTEVIGGLYPYGVHLSNKKWPLKKVSLEECGLQGDRKLVVNGALAVNGITSD